jgi:hypothetical protein
VRPHRLLLVVVGVFLTRPTRATAQPPVSWIGLSLGLEQAAQRNPGASPYGYSGFGLGGDLRYVRRRTRSSFDVGIGASHESLHSEISHDGAPSESVFGVTVDAGLTRAIGPAAGRFRWSAGAAFASRVEYTEHAYAGPFGQSDKFGFLTIGLGPALRTDVHLGTRTLSNLVRVPVVNWIDYPYSNGKANGAHVVLAFASLNTLRAVDDELTYRAGHVGDRGVTWRYRVSYLRYHLAEPRVFAEQSFALALDFPFRRGGRS